MKLSFEKDQSPTTEQWATLGFVAAFVAIVVAALVGSWA